MVQVVLQRLKDVLITPLRARFSSFLFLNITQFFGALNDNIYRSLIAFFLIQAYGIEHSQTTIATAGAIFVIPFLLFSEGSGTLADRMSKRNIIIFSKALELFVMLMGMLCFYMNTPLGGYLTLFLMAMQSAIFGPSKYGIVPELVETERISRANGLLTSFTFLAIIFGTFLGSALMDISNRNFIIASFFCSSVSLVGLFTSFCIEYTPPSGSQKRFNLFFIKDIIKTVKLAGQYDALLVGIFGSAYFMFVGSFLQLNTIPFALQSLGLTDVQGNYLFVLTSLGIGTGSLIAGRLSGKIVELGLVPIGAFGMICGCFLLDAWSDSLYSIIPLMILIGLVGGIYLVPLEAFIQVASPNTHRGQLFATSNFLGFLGVLFSSGLITFLTQVLGLKADKGFTVVGFLSMGVMGLITWRIFDYFVRFLSMIMSRFRFKMAVSHQSIIPSQYASLFICNHTGWNDMILLLGSQHRRMHFFTEEWHNSFTWLKWFHRFFNLNCRPSVQGIHEDSILQDKILKALRGGISACIFLPEHLTKEQHLEIIKRYESFLMDTPYCLIQANISKGYKAPKDRLLMRNKVIQSVRERLRVPASVSFNYASQS